MTTLVDLSAEQMRARIAELEAQNAALKVARNGKLSMKVTEKGGVSVYGLGRFPVTLYGSQWNRLIDAMPQIKAYLELNHGLLAVKGE